MSIFNIISLGGGLALFLFGMHLLATGMEKVSNGKAEKALERLTGNVFFSVLLGAGVTAVVQSSSLTTVLVVGMVNAGILKLQNAVGVIMGANIGTTVTGQILRLGDLESSGNANAVLQLLKPSTLVPIVSIAGIILVLLAGKKEMQKLAGEICLGFGVLFQGMFVMEAAMEPLQHSEAFRSIFVSLQNPFLGVLAGAVVTGVIQSSSASIGILQALSSTGAITFSAAFPIIMGQNIGTCVTSLLSSIGASKNARRAAMVHLYFNLIGTVLFMAAAYGIGALIGGFPFWDQPIDRGGIADFHTIFNVVSTIVMLPFYKQLARLAELTIRDRAETAAPAGSENLLDERFLSAPGLAIEQSSAVLLEMADMALANFRAAYALFREYDPQVVQEILRREEGIDSREDRLGSYLARVSEGPLTEPEQKDLGMLGRLVVEFERIADYAVNLAESAQALHEQKARFSRTALAELETICAAVSDAIAKASAAFRGRDLGIAASIEPLEETVDLMQNELKLRHIRRIKDGQCTIDAGLIFLEILTQIERVSDHCSNIAVLLIARSRSGSTLNRHEYIKEVHRGGDAAYQGLMRQYLETYYNALPAEEGAI
ncbi:MAG TPA: Na/Pi cotransporter family protein [Candidatus Merdivicinus faecavium]|nr:Na/Pi cotransporter family protein [Candidatus Merdivicinus faecavium]